MLPAARFGPSVQRGLGAELRSWLRGHGCGLGAEGLHAPNPASPGWRTRKEWVWGARHHQQSSRAQGAKGSPAPICPLESRGPGAKTACVAFLSRGALAMLFAARGDFPFAECSGQKLVLGRRCDGTSALSGRAGSGGMAGAWAQKACWLRGHGWGLGAEGLRAPNPASPPRRTPGEWVSVAGDPRQSSRAQGAKGSPAPLCPLESRGPGAKTACVAFLSRGALGMFAARGDFPFAECSCQKLVLGRQCDGTSALSGRAGSGGMAGAWAQKAFARPIAPNPASPPRRTPGEWVLVAGDYQQSSRTQGARGTPPSFALRRAEVGG